MKAVRTAVVISVGGALLALPAPARAASLGGFTLKASAAPVAVQIFEPTIPIPASPQLEFDLAYSRATLASGPTGQALSSLMWPGDGVGYGLPDLLKNPNATYPVKVEAQNPGGPADAKQEPVPGMGMTSHADNTSVQAAAYSAKPTTPALPAVPLPGVSVPTELVSLESFSSQSRATTGDKATSTAYATAGSVALLGGLVRIDGLRAQAEADSDGSRGTGTGTVTWTGLSVAGQSVALNQDGLSSLAGTNALPKLPANLAGLLSGLGLGITLPTVDKKASGAGATTGAQGLTITVDTGVLRSKLGLGALLNPLLSLLPSDIASQLTPWLNLGPKLVFILGTATTQAAATPAYQGGAPGGGGTGTGSAGGGTGSGSGGGSGAVPAGGGNPVLSATTTPVAGSGALADFPEAPWYLLAIGLALAGLVSVGLRQWAAAMFGAAECDLGATNGIPDLREH